MRGYLQPARRATASDVQEKFATLSRHRRTKLAKAANTTLVKADQWAHGKAVGAEVATALETAVTTLKPKK